MDELVIRADGMACIKEAISVAVSAFYHPEVFGTAPQNTTAETRMKEYIQKLWEQ